jgi:hypothetical protein
MPTNPQPAAATPPAIPPPGVTFGDAVPTGATFGQPNATPPPDVTFGDQVQTHHWYDSAVNELKELNTGFTTGLSQTGLTAEKGLAMIPGVQPFIQDSMKADTTRANLPMNTPGRMAGNAIENIIEMASGDELLKGASFMAKAKALAPLTQALEKSPAAVQILAKMTGAGARTAALSGAQSAAHGGTAAQVKTAATVGGVLGAAGEPIAEGASKLIDAIKPSTVDVLGEPVTALASQQPGASSLAESVASIRNEAQTSAAQQQASQRALITRAQQVTKRELDNLNAAREAQWQAGSKDLNLAPEETPPTAGTDRQLGTGQPQLPSGTPTPGQPQLSAAEPPSGMARTNEVGAYEGDIPEPQPGAQPQPGTQPQAGGAPTPTPRRVSYIEERPPNFQPIDSHAESQGINSFGQAADKIREHAAPVFDAFDKASGGEYTRLRQLRDAAYANEDYPAAAKAEKGIDNLFDQPEVKAKLDRLDYKTVKSAWRSSKMLDAVDDVVQRSINIPDPSVAEDAGVWRGISGGMLMNGMKRLQKTYGRQALEQVMGSDGVTGLTRMASLLQSPQYAAQYGHVIDNAAEQLIAQTPSKIPKTLSWARSMMLNRVATDPRFAKTLEYITKNRIPQSVGNAAVLAMLHQGQQMTQRNREVVPADQQRGVQPVTLPVMAPAAAQQQVPTSTDEQQQAPEDEEE